MHHISTPIQRIGSSYTVVIIGSGYGGSVLGSRLARAGQRVVILERGREFITGSFPQSSSEATGEFTVDSTEGKAGRSNGLYWARLNKDISVVCGSGLGGTSLINANVSLRPQAQVFTNGRWPTEIAQDIGGMLNEGYKVATTWLQPTVYPDTSPRLPKMQAHEKSAKKMGLPFAKLPINVTFKDGLSASGVPQAACNLCGDCVSGCNVGSKNTLRMNYLPDAVAHGAEIFCEVEVRTVERKGARWLVHYRILGMGREQFEAPDSFMEADIVVLAAGALGSTEILLRSRANGLAVSNMVGQRFTGNGDTLGFAYATKDTIDSVGLGKRAPRDVRPVGPFITSVIDGRSASASVSEQMILEEGNVPGPIAEAVVAMLKTSAALDGQRTTKSVASRIRQAADEAETLGRGEHYGVAVHAQVYLGMGMDDGNGEMSLQGDRLAISWSDVGKQPIFKTINQRMLAATSALEGVFVRDPVWTKALGRRLVTVHPLGGCVMADDASKGVVNHKHLVFTGKDSTAVHDGLYVADGSVIPTPLAVNPLLTITALAERCAVHIAKDRGWKFDVQPRVTPLPEPPARPLGIRFSETMHGHFAKAPDFETGVALGKDAGQSFCFVLTIQADDLEALFDDPMHAAGMTGTVQAPTLSPEPMTVTGGRFNLYAPNPTQPNTQHMRYRMQLRTEAGRVFYMDGFKELKDERGVDIWSDSTTLYITLYDGVDDLQPVIGRGILRLTPKDLAHQLTTVECVNAPDLDVRIRELSRFGKFIFRELWMTHGPVLP